MIATFQLDQITAIVVGDAYYDLHNCFDFVSVEYRPTEKVALQIGDSRKMKPVEKAVKKMIYSRQNEVR